MKHCDTCGQIVAQQITTCPACGSRLAPGISGVDDYQMEKILHEGRSSLVFKARKEGHQTPVTIRLFTDESGVDDGVAARLDEELKLLAKLPPDLFVQHYAIRQSSKGLFYRVSEWVDADNWGSILVSGALNDQRRMAALFLNISSALDTLSRHGYFMPYLILDDILLPKTNVRNLSVKLNFKLSRFLSPRAVHHGPMLKKLLDRHPDMVNQRAIDARTGIWSLGKIFVELLTADHNLTRFSSRVDDIRGLDPELAMLVKLMLSDDPDLRPQSMADVAAALEKILERLPSKPLFSSGGEEKPGSPEYGRWFKKTAVALLVVIALAAGLNAFLFFMSPRDSDNTTLSQFLETHTRSIGFLMVEYWLAADDDIIYRNRVEGTAFLADQEGYLLTNRHVACPWLEDPRLFKARKQAEGRAVVLGHRMFLWFEGDRAFNRLQGLEKRKDLADIYLLSNAYTSGGRGNLRVAGVPRGTGMRDRGIHAPFQHDFAVLKIDTLPGDILPLPLETGQPSESISRLSPVIIMGFPLGSKTQADRINASITRGHVRRTTRDLIQVDSSIYKGNSGGPAISAQGRVIGIASGVITEKPMNQLPLYTPLSDFGLVLPIAGPLRFIKGLKSGEPKWDGVLDFSLGQKVNQVMDLATEEQFSQAGDLAGRLLGASQNPTLIFTAGLMDFCRNHMDSSRQQFRRLLSMEAENTTARLMIYIMDWLSGSQENRILTRPLFTMDWRHPDAFSGYLARVLAENRHMDPNFLDYENQAEQAWRLFIDGLILEKENQPARAAAVYRKVALTAGANDQLFLMALSRLKKTRKALAGNREEMPDNHGRFHEAAIAARQAAKARFEKAVNLITLFESPESTHDQKTMAAELLLELSPFNRTIVARMAFFHAGQAEWDTSLAFIRDYFSKPGRETRLSLGLGLLRGQILSLSGDRTAARVQIEHFKNQIQSPWYRSLAGQLLENSSLDDKEKELLRQAVGSPARRLILHTALGLAAEEKKDMKTAARHYREALGTYLDDWYQYSLARDRLLTLHRSDSI